MVNNEVNYSGGFGETPASRMWTRGPRARIRRPSRWTSGGAMYATLQFSGKDRMNFKMIGDDDKDPGLDFSK